MTSGNKYSGMKFAKDDNDGVAAKLPPWKVYFDGNFWGHQEREKAGKEVSVSKQFIWNEKTWYIPAIYICSKGLVVDFCISIPVGRVRTRGLYSIYSSHNCHRTYAYSTGIRTAGAA